MTLDPVHNSAGGGGGRRADGRRCYHCHQVGHIASGCRVPCTTIGHPAYSCRHGNQGAGHFHRGGFGGMEPPLTPHEVAMVRQLLRNSFGGSGGGGGAPPAAEAVFSSNMGMMAPPPPPPHY